MRTQIWTILLVSSLAPGMHQVHAEDQVLGYAGGRVGYLKLEGVDEGSLNLGLFGAWQPHPHLALVGAFDYHEADFDLQCRTTWAVSASLELYLLDQENRLQPYVVGGVGYYVSQYDFEPVIVGGDDHAREEGYHAGFGLDINTGQWDEDGDMVAINLDARWIFSEQEDDLQVEPDGFLFSVGVKVKF